MEGGACVSDALRVCVWEEGEREDGLVFIRGR